ncbi:Ppx/GppA phosphatase family protein [Arthrobacter tumbae]|uniref:Ppx/GppA phosphatase family protein n=1 Tax=Arthrobacter tumbae TaxID=163874 RepID=UPI0019570E08|nr:Ppx/GppA family phosphatase [Arthrobacter tumbae]MBM7780628.1 exopolyphosphatase/guanosine-5'-triphosphate,3'-diphosphate pyrophosphatase [Arthrobacter tumbae]
MRLGVLDIGSNTVHLLLVDAHPGARPVPYASHKRPLQLVSYLDAEGRISDEGQEELVGFIREARAFATDHRAEDFLAFCTSAIREAGNGEDVLRRVEAETSVVLQELSGDQEAAMTFQAVRRWYGWSAGSILNLDIGGGSFEMAMGHDELPEIAHSVPLGAGRLTREWLPGDPPAPLDVKKLRRHIRQILREPAVSFARLGTPHLVAGTSKTFRSLARMAGAAPSAAGPFVRRTLRLQDLALWAKRLEAMSAADRTNLDGVSELRARQVLAGALVAEAAFEIFDVSEMDICPWALREGLILRRFDTLMFEADEPMPSVGVGHVRLGTR